MSGLDKNDVQRDERKRRKLESEFQREESEKERKAEESSLLSVESLLYEGPACLDEPDFENHHEYVEAAKSRKKRGEITLTLPANISSHPDITACLDRIQLPSDKSSMLLNTIARVGGVQEDQIVSSRCTLERNRDRNRFREAERIRREFAEKTKNSVLALHWDEKLMTDLSRTTAERLAILVSSHPHCVEGKLVCVSTTADGRGATIADEVVNQLELQGLRDHKFGSLVFDTTAANTGVIKGAATIIEVKLGTDIGRLLWCACRHHIPELCQKAVWVLLFGATRSKDKEDLVEFKRDHWDKLDKSVELRKLPNLDTSQRPLTFHQHLKEKAVKNLTDFLSGPDKKLPRDDYREMIDLCLLMLGDSTMDGYNLRRPGATHHAR